MIFHCLMLWSMHNVDYNWIVFTCFMTLTITSTIFCGCWSLWLVKNEISAPFWSHYLSKLCTHTHTIIIISGHKLQKTSMVYITCLKSTQHFLFRDVSLILRTMNIWRTFGRFLPYLSKFFCLETKSRDDVSIGTPDKWYLSYL